MWRVRSQSGFTVFEALTVVSVSAILLAIAVPSLSNLRDVSSLGSAEREIMSALYVARSSAITTNTARRIIFTPPRSIRITDVAGAATYYTRSLDTYGSGISIVGSQPVSVTYDARGLLSPASTVTLVVRNSNRSRTITVYPTGKPASARTQS